MASKGLFHFFDKLEDRIRGRLSYYPFVYAFLGGAGIVIFWRGVWHTVDSLIISTGFPWWDGPLSITAGVLLLLSLGLLVPSFIGNEIIISGIRKEKKIVEKSEKEILGDIVVDEKIMTELEQISIRLERMERALEGREQGSSFE